jgi:hypothetical protein
MCQLNPFTLPCCGRTYVDVDKHPSCPANWPKEKCPKELCIQFGVSEPIHRTSGMCWRCSGGSEPAFNYAKVTLGLEERTPQDRRRETEEGGECWSCNSIYGCHKCGSKKPDPWAVFDHSEYAASPPPPTKNVRRRPESAYDVKKRTKAKGKDIKKEVNTRTTRSSSLRTPGRVTKSYNYPPQARPGSSRTRASFYDKPDFLGYPPPGSSYLPSPADSMHLLQSPFEPEYTQPSMHPSLPGTPREHAQDSQELFNGMSHTAYADNSPMRRRTPGTGYSNQFLSPTGSLQALGRSPLAKMENASELSPTSQYASPNKLGSPIHFAQKAEISQEQRLNTILQQMPQHDGLQRSPSDEYSYLNAGYPAHSGMSDHQMQKTMPDVAYMNAGHSYVSSTSHLVCNS